MRTNVPRAVRALRARRRWRQADLGARAGVSRDTVSRAELGRLEGITLASLDGMVRALGASLSVQVRWDGAGLDRLVDRVHASTQDSAAHLLGRLGWVVQAEVSFNHFGDRGSCDLAALHPATQTLLVVEVKSRLGDLQDTLRALDAKARLAPVLATQLGWPPPVGVARALVIAEHRTARRVVAAHPSLLEGFSVRGRAASRWLRSPAGRDVRLLWFQRLPDSDEVRVVRPRRVRGRHDAG